MAPHLLREPLVLGVYWTLETELAFYGLCWASWRGGWLEDQRVLVGLIVGLCASVLVLRGLIQVHALPAQFAASWKSMPRHLALMFWALSPIVYDHSDGFRKAWRDNREGWVLAVLALLLMGLDGPKSFRLRLGHSFVFPSPYAVAPVFFALWVGWWRVRALTLAWLGRISYSFYLFHLVIAVPLITFLQDSTNSSWRGGPLTLYVGAAFLLTTGLSAVVYYTVELPSIALGKRLTAARPA